MKLRRQKYNYLIGSIAIAASLFVIAARREDPRVLPASLFLVVICVTDTLWARIPNLANGCLALVGLGYSGVTHGAPGVVNSLLGLSIGLGLLLIPYLLGGVGGGDVKALAALGALVGPRDVFALFLYTALIGGVLAVVHYAFANRLSSKVIEWGQALRAYALTGEASYLAPPSAEKLRFPYAAAIAFGYFAHVQWGGPL